MNVVLFKKIKWATTLDGIKPLQMDANLLKAPQLEIESILMLDATTSELQSLRPSNKPFPAGVDPQDPARFDQQEPLLVSQDSLRH